MASSISETELAVLKVLWEQGPCTVRQVSERLISLGRRWAYTTVLTLLQRLHEKNVVKIDRSGFAHVFEAAVSRDELVQSRLGELADELCEGTATPLMLALVEGQKFSPDEIQRLRELLNKLEAEAGPEQTGTRASQRTKNSKSKRKRTSDKGPRP